MSLRLTNNSQAVTDKSGYFRFCHKTSFRSPLHFIVMFVFTSFSATLLALSIFLHLVLGGSLDQGSTSYKLVPTALQPNRSKNSIKEQLPRAFGRSSSLQHSYAPKSKHIDILLQPSLTDHEQKLAIAAAKPRSETPTKSRLPIQRQGSYKQAKELEHEHNGIAAIHEHSAKIGSNSLQEKQNADLFGKQERIRAVSFGRKANAIVKNPNGPKTKWPEPSGDTSWLKAKTKGKHVGA